MKRVEYTRDAVEMIKRGACASDLGWDESFYRRVCRDYGVEPMASPTRSPPIITPIQPTSISPNDVKPLESKHFNVAVKRECAPKTSLTVAVMPDTHCDLREAADIAGTSISAFVRRAMVDAARLGNRLPSCRPSARLDAYVTVQFTVDQFVEFKEASDKIGLKFGVFVRHAIAHALSKAVTK